MPNPYSSKSANKILSQPGPITRTNIITTGSSKSYSEISHECDRDRAVFNGWCIIAIVIIAVLAVMNIFS